MNYVTKECQSAVAQTRSSLQTMYLVPEENCIGLKEPLLYVGSLIDFCIVINELQGYKPMWYGDRWIGWLWILYLRNKRYYITIYWRLLMEILLYFLILRDADTGQERRRVSRWTGCLGVISCRGKGDCCPEDFMPCLGAFVSVLTLQETPTHPYTPTPFWQNTETGETIYFMKKNTVKENQDFDDILSRLYELIVHHHLHLHSAHQWHYVADSDICSKLFWNIKLLWTSSLYSCRYVCVGAWVCDNVLIWVLV